MFGTPRDEFSNSELDILRSFSKGGGGIMFMLDEGGECISKTNVNCFTENYGISVNDDCVVCTSMQTCDHPRAPSVSYRMSNYHKSESLLDRGVVPQLREDGTQRNSHARTLSSENVERLSVALPSCTTLRVQKPATIVLSTGRLAYPVQHAVGAVSKGSVKWGECGRIAVLGSGKMAVDQWYDRADNCKILDLLLHWLVPQFLPKARNLPTEDLDIIDHNYISDMQALANRPRSCLHETDDSPKDFASLFGSKRIHLFQSITAPETALLRDKISMKVARLSLIAPSYAELLMPMQFAAFPAATREHPPPCLELLDLEEEFTSEFKRLNVLSIRGRPTLDDEHIGTFVHDVARVCGLHIDSMRISQIHDSTPTAILKNIFTHLMHLKSSPIRPVRS